MTEDKPNIFNLDAQRRKKESAERWGNIHTRMVLKQRFTELAETMAGEGHSADEILYAAIRFICWLEPERGELIADVNFVADHWYVPEPTE
jgi:hypothetical protein